MARALAVFAHPDDLEFLAAGTFLLWREQGFATGLLLLTSGSGGSDDPGQDPEGLARRREAEARDAAQALGIGSVRFLGRSDGALVADLDLRRDITREIRRFRPDVLVTQDPTQRFSGSHYVNHPDHLAAGEATLAAVYPSAKKALVFPELLAEGLEPHLVSEVYLAASPQPDTWVDIEDVIEAKLDAVLRHRSQFSDPGVGDYVRQRAQENARGTPLRYAETFRSVALRRRSYDARSA